MPSRTKLAAVPLMAALALGCGPRVFEGGSAKVVEPGQPIVVEEPARPEPVVEVSDDKIEISEKIQFAYDSAKIERASHEVLLAVARLLNETERIVRVRVDGHTSSEGSAEHNQDLSERRAAAVVDFLVRKGKVDPARLESAGHGPDQPIASNDDEVGREQNRRVEFVIVEQRFTETTTTTDPSTGAKTVETEERVE